MKLNHQFQRQRLYKLRKLHWSHRSITSISYTVSKSSFRR